jgi:hypothetical protein
MNNLKQDIIDQVRKGVVIPANPLALTEKRKFDEFRQRVLMRYYMDAGAGGIIKIAGINGTTKSAMKQAETAIKLGYDFEIVSLSVFKGAMEQEMLYHMKELSKIIPLYAGATTRGHVRNRRHGVVSRQTYG